MQAFDKNKELLKKIVEDYKKYSQLLSYEEVMLDKKLFLNYQKQINLLQPIALKYEQYLNAVNSLKDFELDLQNLPQSQKEDFCLEIKQQKQNIETLQNELKKLLNNFNAVCSKIAVEIVSNNQNLSTKMIDILTTGYKEFCKVNNLNFTTNAENKKVVLNIEGYNAKQFFEKEIGVHKSISGDVCAIFVFELVDVPTFSLQDVTIQTCRSSGAGGQHVNTTDSSIKAIHNQTQISAVSQDERSQIQNKQKAIERLKQRVEEFYKINQQKAIDKQKKEQLKLIKNNFVVKLYNLENQTILKLDKNQISLKNFLLGKDL